MNMKKLALIAALGAAAIFTACGDDDEDISGSSVQMDCKVTTTDNSATATMSAAGFTSSTTFTVTETGYRMSYGGYDAEKYEPMDINGSYSKDDMVDMANQVCEMYK